MGNARINLALTVTVFFLIISTQGLSQSKSGYVILSNGQRVDCKLKYSTVGGTPQYVTFISSPGGVSETGGVNEIKEFGIEGRNSFRRATVRIDRSSNVDSHLSDKKEPEFHEETLFLEVLVQGGATLYGYKNAGLLRYFIGRDEQTPTQLIYKEYLTYSPAGARLVAKNIAYKQQLKNELQCSRIPPKWFETVSYTTSSLQRAFELFNKCDELTAENLKFGASLNFSARTGVSFSNMGIYTEDWYAGYPITAEFEPMANLNLGIEAEVVPVFDKRRWGLTFESIWMHMEGQTTASVDNRTIDMNYSGFQVNLGLRRYFTINKNFKFYIEGLYMFGFTGSNSQATSSPNGTMMVFMPIKGLSYGGGVTLLDRFRLGYRYFNNPIDFYGAWAGDLTMNNIVAGYRFAKLGK